jgi:hypothetical protein
MPRGDDRSLIDNELIGGGQEEGYHVVDPRRNYHGKPYSIWTTDWFNWHLSRDADSRNSGPVVFLRARGLPNRITGAGVSPVPGVSPGADTSPDSHGANTDEYQAVYANDPNIRIGSDRLQIFQDQAVFVPIIVAYELSSPAEPYKDWGWMQDFTGLTIDYGDNPPGENQLTIDGDDITLGIGMGDFRIATPIFPAVVPDAPFGTSIKDFLEDSPIAPGSYPALVEGYFVMLKFDLGKERKSRRYWVHSWASAPRERARPYFAELLYEIEVRERPMGNHKGLYPYEDRPARNKHVFKRTLYEKNRIGDFDRDQIDRFKNYLDDGGKKFAAKLIAERFGEQSGGSGGSGE